MKSLLCCAAAAALSMSAAVAGPLTPEAARSMSEDELRAAIANAEVFGYRIEADDCAAASCDATAAGAQAIVDAITARAMLDGEGGANAPRIDASADGTVIFRGSGQGLKRVRTGPQVIYLNFDNQGSPLYPVDLVDAETEEYIDTLLIEDYVFTQADRAVIRDRIAADLAPFDVEVVTTPPANGEYMTIDYTDNDRAPGETNITLFLRDDGRVGFSILFGRAEGIDFGNDDYGNGAFSDANFWKVLFDLFSPATFASFTGFSPDAEGLVTAVRNQAANTGAHEAGHALGLRHHDSFGAPDNGLPSTGVPAPGTFVPVYEGPQQGDESILHLMASGASVGLPLAGSAVSDRFFSERSALKLDLAEEARVFDEAELRHDRRSGAKFVDLKRTLVPNTILEGENAGGKFVAMDTAWIQGTLDGVGDSDEYVFSAKRSMFINAELMSYTDSFITDPVIATLNLYKVGRNGSRTLISSNAQTFEPYDPLLVDIEVPSYGQYVLEVVPQEVVYIPLGGGQYFPLPLNTPANESLLAGDYDLLIYQVDRPLGNAPAVGAAQSRLARR
ncbi:hypothetical protein [Parvularcula oceani]|uniref:hypothetical protein n=1 Tax=Parvularcula oceani TaxID=1247963 RepID=UPI0004E120E5|nr:hypothetical protein [Parvularcula oceani]